MLHQIGVGALGPVFRTYEPDRDRLVAVKAFRVDLTPEQAQALSDELARAADAGLFHPSIVEPIAAGVEGSLAYNAEEYVAAESLDVAMRHYAPAAIDTVMPFITQLAGAIDFARAAGVGHGALHPRDIFMTPDEARATGFGVVEALERVGFRAPIRRPYSPPERISGGAWSTPADVFSLAAITYELLTGRRPAGLGAEIGPLTPGAIDTPPAVHDVLARAMDEQPSRRYPTALGFASALEQAAHGKASEATAATPGATPVATTPPPSIAPAIPVTAPPVSAADEEPDDDIAAERDEDDAHHQLTLRELREAASGEELEHVPDLEMDEDSEAEAEADRFAADDFLLDAAGAASVPPLTRLDEFSTTKKPAVDRLALDEDHDLAPAESPSPLFESRDLRHDEPKRHAALPVVEAPPVPPPSFGGYQAPADEVPGRSNRPAILTLVFGLLVGLVGGYALWGRSSTPAPQGRDFSEQVVSPPAPSGGTTTPAPNAPTTGASKPGAFGPSAAAPPPGVSEPAAGNRATPPASPARGATPPRAPSAVGTITVRSTPVGAGVTVNGRWRGRTPLVLEQLPVATYDVRVVQSGYTPARQAVAVTATEPDHVVSLRLQQTAPGAAAAGRGTAPARGATPAASAAGVYTGTVFVDSRPRGARVFIDGKPVGETPLSVPDIRVGTHVVRLELPDHRIWSSTATVTAGQQVRVTGSLERIQ